jgi:hypothetical protein
VRVAFDAEQHRLDRILRNRYLPLSTTFSQFLFLIRYLGSSSQNFTVGLDSFSISPSSGFGDGDDGQPFFLKKKRYLDVLNFNLKLIIQLIQVPYSIFIGPMSRHPLDYLLHLLWNLNQVSTHDTLEKL